MCFENKTFLTLSSLQTNMDTFVNSVDPDETAHNEPSHQDLHCLPFYYLLLTETLFVTMDRNSEIDEPISETWVKG